MLEHKRKVASSFNIAICFSFHIVFVSSHRICRIKRDEQAKSGLTPCVLASMCVSVFFFLSLHCFTFSCGSLFHARIYKCLYIKIKIRLEKKTSFTHSLFPRLYVNFFSLLFCYFYFQPLANCW